MNPNLIPTCMLPRVVIPHPPKDRSVHHMMTPSAIYWRIFHLHTNSPLARAQLFSLLLHIRLSIYLLPRETCNYEQYVTQASHNPSPLRSVSLSSHSQWVIICGHIHQSLRRFISPDFVMSLKNFKRCRSFQDTSWNQLHTLPGPESCLSSDFSI